ncbi:glycoside hydrolase [Crassisporium funariophilum]|nr:glycoside hydrolase [Crassisporium funariophilum]
MRSILALLCCALLTLVPVGAQNRGSPSVPQGFVTTKGNQFQLDGKPFAFVGANSYWLPLLTTKDDVDATFKAMQSSGVKVLRTWGFNAINGSELAGALKSGLTYYQVWNSNQWVLNDGPQGLQRLDYVIETAGKFGIKGTELYINWIAGAGNTHDVFYSNPKIIASYQRYVTTIVNRYKSSPNIFAWELMNEARCLGDLPSGPNCVPGTELLTKWYKQQSDFVRALDSHHMITTGGEGHFFLKNNPALATDYNYDGQAGEDFDLELTLENIDFGTYHLYPESWSNFPNGLTTAKDWGLTWIQDHANSAKKAGKPVVLEEFGVADKAATYTAWVDLALSTQHGIMPWQFGMLGLKEDGGNRLIKYADALINGASPNDGFAIYKNNTAVFDIFTNAANVQAKRSG